MEALDIARYVIHLNNQRKNPATLNLVKLNRILYFIQGNSLMWDDRSAFDENFLAGTKGPYLQSVSNCFKKDYSIVTIRPAEGVKLEVDKDLDETIKVTLDTMLRYNYHYLCEMTKKQQPWKEAVEVIVNPPYQDEYQYDSPIKKESIAAYFKDTYQ